MIATALAFLAGNRLARYALIAALVIGGVALVLFRVRRAGETAGRLAEALATAQTSQEAVERMTDALIRAPRSRRAASDRLRNGDG